MPCDYSYVPVQQRSPEDIVNDQRDESLAGLEQELMSGMAQIQIDPMTGQPVVRAPDGSISASLQALLDSGMADVCVLDAMQQRDTMEWQLAAGAAGVKDTNFATMHGHGHNH